MSWFPKPSSPRAALSDLFAVMRHSSREQKIGGALALVATAIIVFVFVIDSKFGVRPVEVEYTFDLYPTNRTDAQIAADQKTDQAKKEAAQKEQQRQYQKLAKQLGID
jgi:hypothetical protein